MLPSSVRGPQQRRTRLLPSSGPSAGGALPLGYVIQLPGRAITPNSHNARCNHGKKK